MTLIPFDDRDGTIWFNGELVPWRDANIHVLSHALHYASAVFEGQRSYNGTIFKLAEHTERLFNSARILDFEIPHTEDAINQACIDVMNANDLPDGYFRPIAWRGPEMMGVSAQETKIHVAIAGWEQRRKDQQPAMSKAESMPNHQFYNTLQYSPFLLAT